MSKENNGRYIVWKNYDYEGWNPTRFNTLKEAVMYGDGEEDCIITKECQFNVEEIEEDKEEG